MSVAALSACGQESSTNVEPVQAPVEGVRVELLSAGEAPHQPLVWFADSDEQKLTYSVTRGLEQRTEVDKKKAEATAKKPDQKDLNVPYDEVTMDLPLTAVIKTDGDVRSSTVTVGKPSGNNEERNEDIASAEGFEMKTDQDLSGRAEERSFSAPEGASDSARASVEEALTQMNSVPVVFPKEPIGDGASWKVSNRVEDGVSLLQDITYTLVERQNKTATLSVDIERRPATGQLAGTDLDVLDAKSTSSGQIAVDLTHALPERGSINVETVVTYGQKDSPVKVKQRTTSKMTWSPLKNR